MISNGEISAIGKFQKTHALKGELNAILDIDEDFLKEGNAVILDTDGIFVPFFASSVRPKGTTSFLVKLDGIDSESEAKPFVNKTIYGLKSEIAPFLELEENEIRDEDDLVGYVVTDSDSGQRIGEITAIDSSTDNLLFIVDDQEGETLFIPAVEEFIIEVNDDEKEIKMRIPEGLLELNKKNK